MEHSNTAIATPEQRQALRRNQKQRLRDQGEALLRAVEAIEPPTTFKDAEQAAKTLIAVDKAIDTVNIETRDDTTIECYRLAPVTPEAEHAALTSWQGVLDHSLNLLAMQRRLKREQEALL